MPILRSCRKIYCEAIDFLYEHTYLDDWGLNSFLDLSGKILPQRSDAIRKLNLTWYMRRRGNADIRKWERVCDMLARMQRLRVLRIEIGTEIVNLCKSESSG